MKATKTYLLLLCAFSALPLLAALADNRIIGISESDLKKIPIGIVDLGYPDNDNDGLDNDLERSLGTDPLRVDSDRDGFNDKTEIIHNYNPLGNDKAGLDSRLAARLSDKYLLRVAKRGELWYVNPKNSKRYLANNENRKNLLLAALIKPASEPTPPITDNNLLNLLANKIRANDKAAVTSLVDKNYKARVALAMDNLNSEQKLAWANILSSAKLTSQTDTEKIYNTSVYFGLGSRNVTVEYRASKQTDGTWLISKL